MATKNALLERLALARKAKEDKKAAEKPKVEPAPGPVQREVPADPQRELADRTAKDAMVMGWPQAIQKHAYENRIPESELEQVLDEVLAYNDKADPSGVIPELEDWKHEKRGTSRLTSPRGFGR